MQSYLHYLEQVLGLKSVILPQQEPVLEAVPPSPEVRVLFVSEKPLSSEALELFQKMRQAMKLSETATKIISASQVSNSELQLLALSANRVVCFSKALFEALPVEVETKFYTYSPEDLLKNQALKKAAWEDLKQVMKSLGIRA